MALTQVDVQNKESRENKFLSERIIQKALDSGEINSVSVNEITKLFQSALVQHKGVSARVRAETLMSTLREYMANKEKKQIDGTVDDLQRSQKERASEITEIDGSDGQVIQENKVNNENIYEEEQKLLQKIINEKIIVANLSEKLREEASQVVLDETRHIIGTSVSERVFELTVTKALEVFKQKYELAEKKRKESEEKSKKPAVAEGFGVAKEEEEKRKEAKKHEEAEDTSDVVAQDSAQDSTSTQSPQENEEEPVSVQDHSAAKPASAEGYGEAKPASAKSASRLSSGEAKEEKDKLAKKKKLSLTEAILQKAREDDISSPLKAHTLHWPTSTISFGMPVELSADSVARPNKAHTNSNIADKEQNKTTSRSTKTKQINIQKQEVKSKTTESEIHEKEQNIPQETQPKARLTNNDQTPQDLSSASNTKMVFDADLELNSSSIEAKHSLSKQNKELFDKYISEQINAIMETVTQSNTLPSDMLKGIRDDLNKHAVDISKDTGISIKERIQRLDALFQEQKREYTIKKIDNDFDPKEFIDAIIKRSEKEVNTGDQEADARFRKTLRNTLSFKARHLVGSDMDPDLVSKALNEEYAKHRSFYTKNM